MWEKAMDINYFNEFVTLAETCSFVEAANLLYISQSSLSKHIKRMEAELGVVLFDRNTRTVKISQYGELLLPYAKKIADLQSKYITAIESSLGSAHQILNLGSIPDLAQYNITDIIVKYKKEFSKFEINVYQANSDELRNLIRQKKCELAFIRISTELGDDLVGLPYVDDNLVALLPLGHPLAKNNYVELSKLADEDFVLMDKGSKMYKNSIIACQSCGFEPKVAYTDQKMGNLIDMVKKGLGVSLLMKRMVLPARSSEIAVIDVAPCFETRINLCYLKGHKLSEAARSFIGCMETQRDQMGLLSSNLA